MGFWDSSGIIYFSYICFPLIWVSVNWFFYFTNSAVSPAYVFKTLLRLKANRQL